MMKKSILLLAVFTMFFSVSNSQNSKNYKSLWLQVEKHEINNLPKSALEIVDKIYDKAKKENNPSQITKSLFYKSKFALTLEEDAQLKVINSFKTEIANNDFPTNSILENVLANLYWQYFQQNRYKFYRRTKTANKVDENDFRTWDLNTLFEEIHFHFQNSLNESQKLQNTKLSDFNAILHFQPNSKKYRPTLYDFLAHNALDFYKTNETSITKPSYKFEVSKRDYNQFFTSKDTYNNVKDSLSLQLNALKIYQDLILFHHKNANCNAFIVAEIERLNYIASNSYFDGAKDIFFEKITELKEQCKDNEASTLVDFEIAKFYNNQASEYIPNEKTEYQFKNVQALEICNLAIEKFPNSLGAKKCENLKYSILFPSISMQSEKHIPTNKHSRLLVNYKNFSELETSIYKISEREIKTFNTIYNDSLKLKFVNKLTKISSQTDNLKTENDYQKHRTEIIIPPLENGYFLILSKPSNSEIFNAFATSIFQSTNISAVQKSTGLEHIYQIVDRNNGKPFANTKVTVKNYNTGRYNKLISRNFVTDKQGEISFKTNQYHRNVKMYIKTENEYAYFGDYYFRESYRPNNRNNRNEDIQIKNFVFTDRSIYRPGQTVHFKAIFLKKIDEKTELFTNEYVEIVLKNPNGEDVKKLDLKLNEFGSVSGTFILPNNGLTGNYNIFIDESVEHDSDFYDTANFDFSYGSHQISVEEYKRPKFETEFKPITETYKVNDSVKIKGNAMAFAGSSISDAKVKYSVKRKVQFPRWYYWYRPSYNSESQEITHGETKTDSEGNYEITFVALPDKSAKKENFPIFSYEITADVTDINGETRSTNSTVKVGYHTLDVSVSINNEIYVLDKENKLTLTTNNLNGEFVETQGNIKIYKLQSPSNVLRKRLWNVPDYQVISKEKYEELFPHEPYSNDENEVKNWEKGKLVFEQDFDTKDGKEIILKKIKKWQMGKYLIEMTCQDKYDQKVTDKQIFSASKRNISTVADNQLFVISTDKNSYKPLENVQLKIGTSANELFVTLAIMKDYKLVNQQIVKLNNEYKTITIPVAEKDKGGFSVLYSYSAFNEFRKGTVNINVPEKEYNFEIETLTFRDKLQPGEDQTWSFKIKGEGKDKIAAELLASMYDSSLDQFKPHAWSFNPIQRFSKYSYNNWNSNQTFGITSFRVNNFKRWNYNEYSTSFDRLNWFGFSMKNNYYFKYRYDASIRRKEEKIVDNEEEVEEMVIESNEMDLNESVTVGVSISDNDGIADNKLDSGWTPKDSIDISEEKRKKIDLSGIKIRKNFKETAFFFPQLKTDKEGNISFSFTMPEALTRWKLQLLAHNKDLLTATKTLSTVTQKDLMVLPNPPRFLRQGDEILFSSKISNLSEKTLNGVAKLQLIDAISGKEISSKLLKNSDFQNFTIDTKGNTNIVWNLKIPDDVQAVQYKIVAKAGDFSDGEQNVLPVLSNRMLVTETMPMWVRSNQTKTFSLSKLKNNSSTTLKNHKFTLEVTSNPAWYAVQSLPYLMEYPYECAEQTFSRLYANTLASHIANSNPRIKEVFDLWKNSDGLVSNLEKNEELKSIIIQETPWLRDAQNETEQKKRIGLLFDLNKMKNESEIALNKLKQMQFSNGGFPWFKGSKYPNRYITQHIATGYGHLKKLNVILNDSEKSKMMTKAVKYLDDDILDDYKKLLKNAEKLKASEKTREKGERAYNEYLKKNNLRYFQLHYLYMRSFYSDIKIPQKVKTAVDYYTKQSGKYWQDFNLYSKGLISLIQYRTADKNISKAIVKSLKENSITSEEMGMYWKENSPSWFWYQAPIETQALMIEVFAEIENDIATVDELKVWLLKNKQTNSWKTTKQTTDAVYALLLQGSDWLAINETVEVKVGDKIIEPTKLENTKIEAGTGYFKTSWNGNEITPEMADITISKKTEGIAWAGVYWQYFEDLDKITSAETPLKLSKKLFLKSNSDKGKVLTEIDENTALKLGDLVTVRVELKVDRKMEYIHMKDMRASGFEPINVISKYKWQDGLGYYESTKDASTNFFMENLPKGVYVFEYDLRANNAGNFSNGITTIQSMYAPEFSSHSEGVRVEIGE